MVGCPVNRVHDVVLNNRHVPRVHYITAIESKFELFAIAFIVKRYEDWMLTSMSASPEAMYVASNMAGINLRL